MRIVLSYVCHSCRRLSFKSRQLWQTQSRIGKARWQWHMCQKGKKDMSFSINQMNQLANKFSLMGWDQSRVTQLCQAKGRKFQAIEAILDGLPLEEAVQTAARVCRDTTHLTFVNSIMLNPTHCSTKLAAATRVFDIPHICKYDMLNSDTLGLDTPKQRISIYESNYKSDGRKQYSKADFFESFGGDIRSLCLSQGQIIEFARLARKNSLRLPRATLFLFEVEGEFFVFSMYDSTERYREHLFKGWVNSFSEDEDYGFDDDRVCVVVPQLVA